MVVDVRMPAEWEQQRIDGSVNVPLSRLAEEIPGLPNDRPLVVYCSSGYRSAVAASVLRRAGVAEVADLVGGLGAWEAASAAIA
jgi:rhodanese-related sulfurtransferase